ncbi:uncharacterized protein DNG_03191 [Cephalotrichum gorgonifer]|uniref:Calcineurin-like phosphoesterase domain-containing protein n=1 Tax=Cephalotrichum gorgonifer TaxID=2041049 RepID=A0AAE8MTT0_9PEZI|nr:uncharacterized protein DNG_03191 [Cephalotrichum gorgonifer]
MVIAKLTALLANLSICYATCLSKEIHRIQNPTHNAPYSPPFSPPWGPDAPRLLIIGDVHGMLSELEKLLEKAGFSESRGDRVIFAGDMINKGLESAGVVDLAMRINAASVRGNHEDRVLRTWAGAEMARALAKAAGDDADAAVAEYEGTLSEDELKALQTARTMSPAQRKWSAGRPLVLRLGDLPSLGEAAVVHGGMAPGVEVEDQDPWAMYNVRTVLHLDDNDGFANDTQAAAFEETVHTKLRDMLPGTEPSLDEIAAEKERALEFYGGRDPAVVPIDTNEGQWWVEVWNEVEKAKPEGKTLTLFYGHDSKRGINVRDYSFGLDSKCVDGGKLTALVLEPEGSESLKHYLVDVECKIA